MKFLLCLFSPISWNFGFYYLYLCIGIYFYLHILSGRGYLEKWKQDEPKSDQKTYFVLEEQESNCILHADRF